MIWDSSKIDLSALRLRDTLQLHEEFEYPIKLSRPLATPSASLLATESFLRTRRTHRQFGPISDDDLGYFLWLAAHTSDHVSGTYGRVELRPAPSAGARHPIDLLLINMKRTSISVYDSVRHHLDEIEFEEAILQNLLSAGRQVLDYGQGILIWLVAQPARTLAKYEHGEAFVLLDAGALVATLSFAAHALSLAYCPIGISGEPWISSLLNSREQAVGILGGVVGGRAS